MKIQFILISILLLVNSCSASESLKESQNTEKCDENSDSCVNAIGGSVHIEWTKDQEKRVVLYHNKILFEPEEYPTESVSIAAHFPESNSRLILLNIHSGDPYCPTKEYRILDFSDINQILISSPFGECFRSSVDVWEKTKFENGHWCIFLHDTNGNQSNFKYQNGQISLEHNCTRKNSE